MEAQNVCILSIWHFYPRLSLKEHHFGLTERNIESGGRKLVKNVQSRTYAAPQHLTRRAEKGQSAMNLLVFANQPC